MVRPRDTSSEAMERQRAVLRAMAPAERLAKAAALSDEVRRLAEAGIRARRPELTGEQVEAEIRTIMERAAGRSTPPAEHPGG